MPGPMGFRSKRLAVALACSRKRGLKLTQQIWRIARLIACAALITLSIGCSQINVAPSRPPPTSTQKLAIYPGAFQVNQSGGPPDCCQHVSYLVRDKLENVVAFYDDLAKKDGWHKVITTVANKHRYGWTETESGPAYTLVVNVSTSNGITSVDATLSAQAPY